jgi:signal transduction histidine kinase
MVLELVEPREFSADEQEFVLTLGRQCAQALERARLYAEAQKHNAELEQNVRKRTQDLENSQAQLRDLSARMAALREEERARLSREIHDELGGSLTAMKINATQIRRAYPGDATLQTQTKNLLEVIDDTIQKVRQIATDLRPSILDDFGLLAALEWQLQEFQRRSEIECQLLPTTQEVVVDRDSAIAIFRIFQETLTNVARHAQATRVVVSLEQVANHLLLSVQDNGRGISTKELVQSKSLGLAGMRERVHLMSGQLNIQGKPGQGTTVLVKIPLPPPNGEQKSDLPRADVV